MPSDKDYDSVTEFRLNRDISEGDIRVAFDSDAAITAIKAKGYYLHEFKVVSN